MTLDFTQGQMNTTKLELMQSFCCKVAQMNPMLCVDYFKKMISKKSLSGVNMDYLRMMTSKKSCECGKYGSLVRLLFFSSCKHVVCSSSLHASMS